MSSITSKCFTIERACTATWVASVPGHLNVPHFEALKCPLYRGRSNWSRPLFAENMSTPPKKCVLVVTGEFTFGGAAFLTLRHMKRLLAQYEIDFLVTGPCEDEMLRELPEIISLYRLSTSPFEHTPDVLGSMDALGCLELFLKRGLTEPLVRSYQAVLATSVFADWRACIAVSVARAERKLVFLLDEALAEYPQQSPRDQSAIDSCLLAADQVLPVSMRLWQAMANHCPALKRRPMQVLRPPVEICRDDFQFVASGLKILPRDLPVVLTVARLVPGKQILECLRVHHRLRQAGVEFRWYVMGSGPDERMLRTEINRLGMTDAFVLIRPQEKNCLHSLMRQCDVFALFSVSEGCPTVIIEALMLDCAVITSDVNGANEMIDSGRTGLIVDNDVEAMANGLRKLILNPHLRDHFRNQLAEDPPVADVAQETALLVNSIEAPVPFSAVPKVSILIPTHNHERYIDRTIASALMQDFGSLEVIVADDASTDRTGHKAGKWASDERFRYIRNECQLGRLANYRKLLNEHARGEWVLMLDGDDHLTEPGFVRHAYEAIQHHAGSNIVFAQAGQREQFVGKHRPDLDVLPEIDGQESLMKGADYLRFVFTTGFFSHLGSLYNRAAAIQHEFYAKDVSSSDMDSLLRLALAGEVLVLKTIAGCWVQHGQNASANVPMELISANMRIFRQITNMAVQRGLISPLEINGALTRYEGRTLAHLFCQSLVNAQSGPTAVFKIFAIIVSTNPYLLLSFRIPLVMLRFAVNHFRDRLLWKLSLITKRR